MLRSRLNEKKERREGEESPPHPLPPPLPVDLQPIPSVFGYLCTCVRSKFIRLGTFSFPPGPREKLVVGLSYCDLFAGRKDQPRPPPPLLSLVLSSPTPNPARRRSPPPLHTYSIAPGKERRGVD